jgi:hypothetical protein
VKQPSDNLGVSAERGLFLFEDWLQPRKQGLNERKVGKRQVLVTATEADLDTAV